MRILHIITGLDLGGAEKLLLNTCSQQLADGDSVEVVYLKTEGFLVDDFLKCGAEVNKLDISGFGVLTSFFKLVKKIKTGKYDVIHCHLPHAAFIGRTAALLAGHKNIVNTIHGTDRWYISSKPVHHLIKYIDTLLNNRREVKIVAISKAVRDFLRDNGKGLKAEKISIIYNAISFDEIDARLQEPGGRKALGIEEKDYVICNIGRLGVEKGHIFILKALAELINEEGLRNIKCLIIGDGSLRSQLEAFIKENSLQKNVFLLGVQTNPYKYLGLSDLFVMPSLYEGFGIAVLEAYYCRVPVIASNIEGLLDAVQHGVTGISIDAADHLSLKREIKKFYYNEYDREALIGRAREFVKKFEIKEYTKKLKKLYTI